MYMGNQKIDVRKSHPEFAQYFVPDPEPGE
jgi:hypothetical protein